MCQIEITTVRFGLYIFENFQKKKEKRERERAS
jgi:hypothetical protein